MVSKIPWNLDRNTNQMLIFGEYLKIKAYLYTWPIHNITKHPHYGLFPKKEVEK
jgi:hypothetical protein